MLSFNQSTLRAAACPFRFSRLRARKGRKQGSQDGVTNVGRGIHAFAAEYFEHCWKNRLLTDTDEGLRLAERMMVGSGLDERERDDFLALAEGFVACEVAPDRNAARVEAEIRSPDGRFYGTPDLVELPFGEDPKLARVTDYKSWRRIRPEGEMRADIQLPLYAGLIIEQNPQVERVYCRYVFLRYGREYPRMGHAADWCMERPEIEAFMNRMRRRAEELEALTEFEPQAGTACDWCECTADCPLVAAKEVVVIGSAGAARAAASQVYVLDSLVKRLKARLKGWVDVNGEVELSGVKLAFVPQVQRRYALADVVKAFQGEGVRIATVLGEANISQTGIKRVGKQSGTSKEVVAAILALGEEDVKTVFRFAKVEDDAAEEEET